MRGVDGTDDEGTTDLNYGSEQNAGNTNGENMRSIRCKNARANTPPIEEWPV